jgi:hypothetical protein
VASRLLAAGRVHQLDGGVARAGGKVQASHWPQADQAGSSMRPNSLCATRCSVPLATSPTHSSLRWLASGHLAACGAARIAVMRPSAQGRARVPSAVSELDLLFAAGVAGQHQRLAIGQPLRQAAARRAAAVLAHRAFPQAMLKICPRASSTTLWPAGCSATLCRFSASGTCAARGLGARAWARDGQRCVPCPHRVVQPQLTAHW